VVGRQLFIGNQNFGYQPNSSQYIIGCLNFGRAHLGTKPNMPEMAMLLASGPLISHVACVPTPPNPGPYGPGLTQGCLNIDLGSASIRVVRCKVI
jgi:hypothetical protein